MKHLASKKKVLIIDDEQELCMLMEMVLERSDFVAKSVHTLEPVLDEVDQLKPDYIFLDNHLPDGRGVDIIRTILNAYPPVKIVMMTAYNERLLNEKAITEGASYFLHKPFNRNNIENIIKALK